jgi:hypothetical protein
MPIIKNKYVELPVVKKLPVLLRGKISAIKRKIKGIIKLSFKKVVLKKYFLINDK